MKYESSILKRLVDTYGFVGNPHYISEVIKEFIVRGKERFPNLFTYQSDWLAHIDEFGLNPTYTVSYTGQSIYAPNTLERPVKSAILKGQTLVNLFKNKVTHRDTGKFIYVEEGDKIQATFKDGVTNGWIGFSFKENVPFEIGKTYTVMNELYKCDDQLISFNISLGNKTFTNTKPVIGINKLKIIIPSDYTEGINWMYYNVNNTNNSATIFSSNLLILEGDYTQEDIPYFEGMQSVKMPVLTTTGKNLFDGELQKGYYDYSGTNLFSSSIIKPHSSVCSNSKPVIIKENTYYTFSNDTGTSLKPVFRFTFFDINGNFISTINPSSVALSNYSFLSPSSAYYFVFNTTTGVPLEVALNSKYQLEEGSTATSYEPFKSNILTVNEDVVLRKVGDVQDTLDCLTGEVTERICENVLDDSAEISISSLNSTLINTMAFGIATPNIKKVQTAQINDKFPSININDYDNDDYEHSYASTSSERIWFFIDKSKLTENSINGVKQWLSQNPITVQYQLATESIKTVDLSILNQNNQNVKQLMSFNGGTHFNTTSLEGSPLPVVSVSVETDLEETLMMCSLEGYTM